MNHKFPFVPISCNTRALALFDDLADAGLMTFCLLCATQVPYRNLAPGEFFFSQAALARRLHISRETLNRRLKNLSDAGFLDIRTDQFGTTVCIRDWQAWHHGDIPTAAKTSDRLSPESVNPYSYAYSYPWSQIQQSPVQGKATTNNNKKKRKEEQRNINTPARVSDSSFSDGFDELWSAYPAHRRLHKEEALLQYRQALQSGASIDAIMNALSENTQSSLWEQEDGRFIPGIVKWLKSEPWNTSSSPITDNDRKVVRV